MWLLAAAVFLLGKLAMRFATGHPARSAGIQAELGWWLAWPGMDASAFFQRPGRLRGRRGGHLAGLPCLCLGVALVWGGARLMPSPFFAGWAGMVGLVLMLHFGIFRLLCGWWQSQGREVTPLMNQPLLATSLADFWGRRWNRAFRDLAHTWLFLPVRRRCGTGPAALAVFLGSGLVHELVITVPAGAGWGGPTVYFLVQAAALWWERRHRRAVPPWRQRLRVILVTAGPVGLLFPPPFVERVIVPFLTVLNALP